MAKHEAEVTDLATTEVQSGEVQSASLSAASARQLEIMATLALRRPRNEDAAFQKIAKALSRPELAEQAMFNLPRGKKKVDGKWVPNIVSGPSVHLARAFLTYWENLHVGYSIVADAPESMTVRGACWDLEHNNLIYQEAQVPKLVQKRIYDQDGKYQRTAWVTANADEMRERTANIAARLIRNCILQSIPRDRVDDAIAVARRTLLKGVKQDPDKARKGVVVGFSEFNISVEQLEEYLGHKVAEATAEELTNLIGIGKAIRAGERKWSDYAAAERDANGTLRPSDLQRSGDPNRGHDQAAAPAATTRGSEPPLGEPPGSQKGLGW